MVNSPPASDCVMGETMTSKPDILRRKKLQEILALIEDRECFRCREIQFLCSEAKPACVTKVLKQWQQEGVLEAEASGRERCYTWRVRDFSPARWIDQQIQGDQVSQLPTEERPRERLLDVGARS